MDNNIRVLFVNQFNSSRDVFNQDLQNTLVYLKSQSNLTLEEIFLIEDAKEKLTNTDILIIWVDTQNSGAWHDFIENSPTLYYLGFIVVFESKEGNLLENAREAMLRQIYPFVCPIDFDVFQASIEAIDAKMKYRKSLRNFKNALLKADSLDSIVDKALQQLKDHPLVGYQEATISLVDKETKTGKRYLLKIDPSNSHPDRTLHKEIQKDKLITKVDEQTVVILESIYAEESKQQFIDWGWEYNKSSTQDIKSWIGLAAKYQDQTVAIITLHHQTPRKYEKSSQKLVKFLRDFGEIFANAIENFFLKRNKIVVEEIINEMGDDLKSKDLIIQILQKLKDELKCDTCNYFLTSYDAHSKETFLSELTSSKDNSNAPKKSSHTFKKGVGIAGSVLKDGKSRIVPHACEDDDFLPTLNHPGYKLSMLAVPVIPISDKHSNQPNRIIGIICCYKEEPDYFTVYDRDLVADIALSAATVIERTMTLEFSNEISSEMAQLVVNPDKTKLLEKICQHALKVTNSGSASIHLLQYIDITNYYRSTGDYYTAPPNEQELPPRLDGQGTTDLVIEANQTVEFSEKNGNFARIAESQRQKGVKYKIVVPLRITKDDKSSIIGALYLNKYSDEPFSAIEKFAIELFASQAANIIYDQKILVENKFRSDAHEGFAKAIEVIASTDDIDLLLQNIAKYSYSLVNANFSYLVIRDSTNKFKVKAAWPEYILTDLENKYCEVNQIGITGIVAKTGIGIIINDIHEEKKINSEYGQAYVEFKKETRSELAVPILEKDGTVIGVINLEHDKTYAFTPLHQKVIEYFAKQVGIAFQKKNLIEGISINNNTLRHLHLSLQNIMQQSLQNMLSKVVSLTCEALEAEEVIVIPYKGGKNGSLIILEDEIVPIRCLSLTKDLEKMSSDVYAKQEEKIYPEENSNQDKNDFNCIKEARNISYGLCLPFSFGLKKIGVMWILFSDPSYKKQLEKDKDMYKIYINQIALAYENAEKFEELKKKAKEDLSRDIKLDYKNARRQATFFFAISVVASLTGLGLIFASVPQLLKSDTKNLLNGGAISAVAGVLLEAITILAFNRAKEANERLDRYHQEIYHVGELSILLSATEQLDPQIMQEEKQKIIQTTTNHWLKSINEVKNNDNINVNEVKNTDK